MKRKKEKRKGKMETRKNGIKKVWSKEWRKEKGDYQKGGKEERRLGRKENRKKRE